MALFKTSRAECKCEKCGELQTGPPGPAWADVIVALSGAIVLAAIVRWWWWVPFLLTSVVTYVVVDIVVNTVWMSFGYRADMLWRCLKCGHHPVECVDWIEVRRPIFSPLGQVAVYLAYALVVAAAYFLLNWLSSAI